MVPVCWPMADTFCALLELRCGFSLAFERGMAALLVFKIPPIGVVYTVMFA